MMMMLKSETRKSKFTSKDISSSQRISLDMIHNKQYPFYPIPTGKTQEGGKIPSHEHLQRLSAVQAAGWLYEQKVRNRGKICSESVDFSSNRIIVGLFINFLVNEIFV